MKNNLSIAKNILISFGINENLFNQEIIRSHSILYMFYWFDRLKNNKEEQNIVAKNIQQYLKESSLTFDEIIHHEKFVDLLSLSKDYVTNQITPVQTVDLVIERNNKTNISTNEKEVLLFERPYFPHGISLPGGLLEDSDEDNPLNLDAKTFAALRIAADKVLFLDKKDRKYKINHKENGEIFYSVESINGTKKIIIHPTNIYGYSIKENLQSVLRPSDPRHLVDTIGFKCELIDDTNEHQDYFWESKQNLLNKNIQHENKKFAFNHHKEIILNALSKTSLEEELNFNELKFVKNIIENPHVFYSGITDRFNNNKFNPYTSFPELFPTVNKLMNELFTDDINNLCKENDLLIGFRDKVVNSLRHVSLKNRTFCSYLPTLQAIFQSIAFFDVVARHKKDFYHDINSDEIIEHNPKEKKNAAYHMYKYEYRMNELLSKIPDEIIIPTFANLSATELMKVRGVPIRFVGLSKDFIYVDEFEQSPEEFLMHDLNHSYRMSDEDYKYMDNNNLSRTEFIQKQNSFVQQYLSTIKISESDNEKTREIKKLKKIILFEICHEDAKPLLPDIIIEAIMRKEGGETKFELPTVDPKTHYMDIVDVLDTEISTLSYVRNKLQCGFYDKVDNQNNYIVKPEYRKSEFIAQAAYEILHEMSIILNQKIDIDYNYLLKRTCSVGPNNIYNPVQIDENVQKLNDGASFLNPKRYLA